MAVAITLEYLMSFSAAVVVAYMVGMVIAFTLFNRYVFPASPRPLAEQIKFFVLVTIAGIIQVWIVSMALVYHAFPAIGFVGAFAESVAHGLAIGVPTVSSYFGHKSSNIQRRLTALILKSYRSCGLALEGPSPKAESGEGVGKTRRCLGASGESIARAALSITPIRVLHAAIEQRKKSWL